MVKTEQNLPTPRAGSTWKKGWREVSSCFYHLCSCPCRLCNDPVYLSLSRGQLPLSSSELRRDCLVVESLWVWWEEARRGRERGHRIGVIMWRDRVCPCFWFGNGSRHDHEASEERNPVLLVSGMGGSILHSKKKEDNWLGFDTRVWVRILLADLEFKNKLWSLFNPSTGLSLSAIRMLGIPFPHPFAYSCACAVL